MRLAGFRLLNPHVYLDTVLLMGSIGARPRAWQLLDMLVALLMFTLAVQLLRQSLARLAG